MPVFKNICLVQPFLINDKNIEYINNDNINFIEKIKNNSIRVDGYIFKDNKLYQSVYNYSYFEEVSFSFFNLSNTKLTNYEFLFDEWLKFIEDSLLIMPKIKTTNTTINTKPIAMYKFEKIKGVLYSIIDKISYSEYSNTIDFLCEFLERLTMCHEFFDGNKRTALLFFKKLLRTMGFYIKWSSIEGKYVGYWENFMEKISLPSNVISFQDKKKIIEKSIEENVWFSF